MPDIELHPAHVWDCDECGTENFCRTVVFEGAPEELEAMRLEHGLEDGEEGEFVTMPEEVTCRVCGACFTTKDYREDEA